MGILPEALRNYLALLGWSPADGVTEIMRREQLVAQFSLDHIIKAPAVFDDAKLNWMNRHYMKECAPRRLAELSVPLLVTAGYLPLPIDDLTLSWLERVLDAVLKNLDHLDQVPAAVKLIFEYDASSFASGEETMHVLEDPGAREVLQVFIPRMLALDAVNYERFREVAKAVQKETGRKGKDLFHPIRVALTGAASGPELEKLIPIFEEGSKLPLARHVKSCAERLREFEKLL
jgi:glutamyl-tRNA synthetase/nondiscriminating glutamyl-tRNA synthetase